MRRLVQRISRTHYWPGDDYALGSQSPDAPVPFSLTMWANTLSQPVAHKQFAALQAPTPLALEFAFRLWLWFQFAMARRRHASRKRLSIQFHPGRVVVYLQRRHSTFRTWPPAPKEPTTSMRRKSWKPNWQSRRPIQFCILSRLSATVQTPKPNSHFRWNRWLTG